MVRVLLISMLGKEKGMNFGGEKEKNFLLSLHLPILINFVLVLNIVILVVVVTSNGSGLF